MSLLKFKLIYSNFEGKSSLPHFFKGVIKAILFVHLLILFCSGLAIAQKGARTMTLDECLEIGRTTSPAAKIAKNAYLQRKYNYDAFKADYYPQLSLTGQLPGLNRSINPTIDFNGIPLFIQQSNLNSYGALSLSQKIPWTGGNIYVSSEINRYDNILGNKESTSWGTTPIRILLNQPIFQVNTMSWDLKIQALLNEQNEKKYAEDMEDIAVDVSQKFFNLYIDRMNVYNAEKNVSTNDTLYTLSKGRYEVGKIAENDLLQSELGLMNVRNDLDNAKLSYRQAMEVLKITLGLDFTDDLIVIPPLEAPYLKIDPKIAIESALNNRSNVISYKINKVNAEMALATAENTDNFNATINASYGLNQTAAKVPDAYKNLFDQERFNITFEVPLLLWGKASSRKEAAYAGKLSAETSIDQQMRYLEMEVKYQTLQFELLQEQVAIRAKADTVASRRFEVAKNRYLIGKIDMNTFFIAQNEKDSALQTYIQTMKNFWTAYYRLRRVTLYDFAKNEVIKYKMVE